MGGLWYFRIESDIDKCRHFHLEFKNELHNCKKGWLRLTEVFKDIFILNDGLFQILTDHKHNLSQQDSEAEET